MNNLKFSNIGIFVKSGHTIAKDIADNLAKWLIDKEARVYSDTDLSPHPKISTLSRKDIAENINLAIVLGGDGTFLSVARLITNSKIPIIGINLGNLGFLTEVTLDEMYLTLDDIFRGDYTIDERMMLSISIFRDSKKMNEYSVLNDIVVNKGALARIVSLQISINEKYVTTFRSDGLITSTPTGSTAYSLSAGGPILYPNLNSIIITPICPHTLTHRPIVVSGDSLIEVKMISAESDVFITLDGQIGFPLKNSDTLIIKKSDKKTFIINSSRKDYFQILRNKLKWGLI